ARPCFLSERNALHYAKASPTVSIFSPPRAAADPWTTEGETMLDKLRDSSRSFGTYLIFGVIILVFVVYFGPGGQSCGDIGAGSSIAWAAKVDGEEISLRDFRSEYENLYRQYQAQMGDRFDPAMAQQMGIRSSAIDRLVTRKLLIRE